MSKFALSLLAASSFFAVAANAAVFTDRAAFIAATSGQTVEGFTAPTGNYTAQGSLFSGAGFTITSTGATFTVDPDYYPDYYQWNSGAVFDAERSTLTFTVNPGVTAFGFDFGNPSGLDSAGSVITINGVDYGGYARPTFAFFGITGLSIAPIVVNFNGGLGIIDNVTTAGAVPEPATWGLMIGGFGMVGFAARRRVTAVSA